MTVKYVNPEQAIHPLRHELNDDEIREIIVRVHEDDDTLTLDEIDCALDWLYDYIASENQNVEGVTTLQ